MKRIIPTLATVVMAIGLTACSNGEATPDPAPVTTTSSTTTSSSTTTTPTGETTTSESLSPEPTTAAAVEQPTTQSPAGEQAPPVATAPTFVQCWENDAAQMSDDSIVYDPVNCHLASDDEIKQREEAYWANNPDPYADPYRTDGCVGPAATCGYYDEYGNPIWFDKTTGETSPRYYDEYGNPTMEAP